MHKICDPGGGGGACLSSSGKFPMIFFDVSCDFKVGFFFSVKKIFGLEKFFEKKNSRKFDFEPWGAARAIRAS